MPIFSTNKTGDTVRWISKRTLQASLDSMAANFLAERHETARLRSILTTDNIAWGDLVAAFQDLVDENDNTQRQNVELNRHITTLTEQRATDAAVLNESRRVRTTLADRIAVLVDERNNLQREVDHLQRESAEAVRRLDVATALNDRLDDGAYESAVDSIDALLHACSEADADRMAAVGRAGRLGTKRIRTILGRS